MKKIFITLVLSLSLYSVAFSTPQIPDILIYKGDTMALRSYPLSDYFRLNDLKANDIFRSEWFSTGCYRGYTAVWTIENNKLYLTDIHRVRYNIIRGGEKTEITEITEKADLNEIFKEKVTDGKVLAYWLTDEIFAQYGKVVHEDYFFGQVLEKEMKISVLEGEVTKTDIYSTLTGEDSPQDIRIWNGEKIDHDTDAKIQEIIVKNFKWDRRHMKHNATMDVMLYINDDLSSILLTETEYDRNRGVEMIVYYREMLSNAKTDEKVKYVNSMKIYNYNSLEKLNKKIEQEYKENGVYLNQLKRIVEPLKVETILAMGQPYFCIYSFRIIFDAKNKKISFEKGY